jgi:hypothetical protein
LYFLPIKVFVIDEVCSFGDVITLDDDDDDDDDNEYGHVDGDDKGDEASVCLISFNKLYKLVSSDEDLFSVVFNSWVKKLDILLSLLIVFFEEFMLLLHDIEAAIFCPNDNSFELSSLIINFLYLFNSVLSCSLFFSDFV